MKNEKMSYEKGNDVTVLSLSTHENLKLNPQICHTSYGEQEGTDELVIVFSAADPAPVEEREAWAVDPNEPLVVLIESREQADHLITTLQMLRTKIWGLNLEDNRN